MCVWRGAGEEFVSLRGPGVTGDQEGAGNCLP
jgi:hypothetical protein